MKNILAIVLFAVIFALVRPVVGRLIKNDKEGEAQ